MARRRWQDIPEDLVQLRKKFDQWRTASSKRRPFPDHLWQEAVHQAKTYGISPVAQQLKVNYQMLKQRTLSGQTVPAAANNSCNPIEFIELHAEDLHLADGPRQCMIELDSPERGKMTIRLTGWYDREVARIARAWGTPVR